MKRKLIPVLVPLGVVVLILICVSLLNKEKIRKNCDQISYVKYLNVLRADGFDTIPEEGRMDFVEYRDSLCLLMNKCIPYENGNKKISKGFIDFFFFNDKNKKLGVIQVGGGSQYGYYISLGGSEYYSQEVLPYFLFDKIRKHEEKNSKGMDL